MTGIYFLSYKDKIIYIGQTKNWPIRAFVHKQMNFDQVRLLECEAKDLDIYEARAIRFFKPIENIRHCKPAQKKLTDEWVLRHEKQIKGLTIFDKMKGEKLAKVAKIELGYSARTSICDIWTTIFYRYRKLKEIA